MRGLRAQHPLAPWAGVTVAPAAWFVQQQGLGQLTYFACGTAGPWTVVLSGLAALAATLAAGLWSLSAWRDGEAKPEFDVRRFVALGSVMAAGLFALAVVFQSLAGLLIPGCAR
jgi:hypothetical protein